MGTMTMGSRPDAATEMHLMLVRQRMAERLYEAECDRLARAVRPAGGTRPSIGMALARTRSRLAQIHLGRPKLLRGRVGATAISIVFALCLSGCSASASQPSHAVLPATGQGASAAVATAAATPVPPRAASCTTPAAPTTGAGVTLYQNARDEVNAQVELVSAAGHRVLIDVGDASLLTSPGKADDILVNTHEPGAYDAWYEPDVDIDTVWASTFPGEILPAGGSGSSADFTIVGTRASHGSAKYPGTVLDGSDNVESIEVGGLRVVDFGDFGQPALTQKQLDRIGRVDVAITALDNEWSGITMKNRLAFDLMAQVCPRIVIPTGLYNGADDIAVAKTLMPVVATSARHVLLTPAKLPNETTILLMGDRGASIGKQLGLPASTW